MFCVIVLPLDLPALPNALIQIQKAQEKDQTCMPSGYQTYIGTRDGPTRKHSTNMSPTLLNALGSLTVDKNGLYIYSFMKTEL